MQGIVEEGSGGINGLQIESNIIFEAGPRKVGLCYCTNRMARQTLVHNKEHMLYSSVHVRARLSHNECGTLRLKCVFASSNVAVYGA
jgi:hypothetical protein